jgi:hypothetical protein
MITVEKVTWSHQQLVHFLDYVPKKSHVTFINCHFIDLHGLPLDGWPDLTLTFTNSWFAAEYMKSWALGDAGWQQTGPSLEG